MLDYFFFSLFFWHSPPSLCLASFVYLCISPRNRIKRLCKGPNQSCPVAHTLCDVYIYVYICISQCSTYAPVPVMLAQPANPLFKSYQPALPLGCAPKTLSQSGKQKNSIFNLAISCASSFSGEGKPRRLGALREKRCILVGIFLSFRVKRPLAKLDHFYAL